MRAAYDVSSHDTLSLLAFGSYDYAGKRRDGGAETLFGTEFHRVDLRHERRLTRGTSVRTALTLGLDRTRLGGESESGGRLVVRDYIIGLRSEVVSRLTERALVHAGADALVDSYDTQVPDGALGTEDLGPFSQIFSSCRDLTLGLHADISLEPSRGVQVTPGLRLDYYGVSGIGPPVKLVFGGGLLRVEQEQYR